MKKREKKKYKRFYRDVKLKCFHSRWNLFIYLKMNNPIDEFRVIRNQTTTIHSDRSELINCRIEFKVESLKLDLNLTTRGGGGVGRGREDLDFQVKHNAKFRYYFRK